jgi:hypothetical protein
MISKTMFENAFNQCNEVHYNELINGNNLIENILFCIIEDLGVSKNYEFTDFEIMKIIKHTNKYLIKCGYLINNEEYLFSIHKIFYKHLDINFKQVFDLLLEAKVKFSVPHDYLYYFKILEKQFNNNNIEINSNINRLLTKSEFKYIECKDYIKVKRTENKYINNVDYENINDKRMTTYYLTSDAFKKILMRSTNTDKYCDYFILIERVFTYYKDYIIKGQEIIKEKGEIRFNKVLKDNENFEIKLKQQTFMNKLLQKKNEDYENEINEKELELFYLKDIEDKYFDEEFENKNLQKAIKKKEKELDEKDKLIEYLNDENNKLKEVNLYLEGENDDLHNQLNELEMQMEELQN